MLIRDLEKLVVKLFNNKQLTQKDYKLIKQCVQNNQTCSLLTPK